MQSARIQIFGIVQGVGFRPFVHRLAMEHGIKGSVANRGSYVEVFLQSEERAKEEAFLQELTRRAPERSLIMKVSREDLDLPPFTDFSIVESAKEEGDIFVSPDIAICPLCQEELFDPGNRRYLHPFINCTACGPRLTILDTMPYDRERTSMKSFPMCEDCHYEYTHAETRRYDAQPVCCNDCGPTLELLRLPGAIRIEDEQGSPLTGVEAIRTARAAIMEGKIVAIKGIGGFHLACDATNDHAVARLREKKQRLTKPFAVMFRYLASLAKYCHLTSQEEELLTGWQKPIVLLERTSAQGLSRLIAPGNPMLGAMLPYTPLHLLLFSLPDGLAMTEALIMTSGNISGAPICHTNALVRKELTKICDLVLTHNRHINLRCDDSVLLVESREEKETGPKTMMLRRSRGFAPLPQVLSRHWQGDVLGIGGELKNTFCLGKNALFYLSPHIGDLSDIRTVAALRETLLRMQDLLNIRPKVVACDSHPRYNSSEQARELGLPVLTVQHHFAHVISCMAENDVTEPVIGVAFDGTGDGEDGTIWGSEILKVSLTGFERLASIEPFSHTGGDKASSEGYRIAISMLTELFGEEEAVSISQVLGLADREASRIQAMLTKRGLNTVLSTSAGRLFDSVSALLGFARTSSFEGEAACALQFAAEKARKSALPKKRPPLTPTELIVAGPLRAKRLMPTFRLVHDLVQMALKGEDRSLLALSFHEELSRLIVTSCLWAREYTQINTCCLTGGVFQNRLLSMLCHSQLEKRGFRVLRHRLVPANDGGLALGQAVYAMSWLQEREL